MSASQKIGYESDHHINNNPFQRGAMSFEDYNYNQFNKYILVDEKGRTVETKSSNSSLPQVEIIDKKEDHINSKSDDEEEYDAEIEEDAKLSEEKFLPSGARIISGDAGNLFSKPAS